MFLTTSISLVLFDDPVSSHNCVVLLSKSREHERFGLLIVCVKKYFGYSIFVSCEQYDNHSVFNFMKDPSF